MLHPVVCNPVLSPVVAVLNPVRWRAGKLAPDGAILHWDADLDAFTEQTGGPHTFNHNVLGPQFQRNADGSYTNVGAKPAVDVFGGKKWLRSCGAVTNLLPSGAEDISGLAWNKRGTAQVAAFSDGANLITGVNAGGNDFFIVALTSVSVPVTPAISIKKVSGSGVLLLVNPAGSEYGAWEINFSLLGDGFEDIHSTHPAVTFVNTHVSSSHGVTGLHFRAKSGGPLSFYARNPQLTATAYPVPYVPPGVTQPASNATTTNGSWFSLPDGSELWKALDGEIQQQNLITNGNFDTNIDGWNVYAPTAAILSWQNGKLRIQNNGAAYGAANQAFSTVVGGLYEISVGITIGEGSPSGFTARARCSNAPDYLAAGTILATTSGTYKFRFSATSTTTYLLLGNRNDRDAYSEFDNISIKRIQPQPLTLATRVRMGVGSGDLANSTAIPILSCTGTGTGSTLGVKHSYKDSAGNVAISRAYDGTTSVIALATWPRDSIIRRVTQVNTAGTRFRVGYMIEGTHTAIQWSSWANYDGSFNPSTHYRLLLGFNNVYPMWFNKITAWKKQATDAEILEAMA